MPSNPFRAAGNTIAMAVTTTSTATPVQALSSVGEGLAHHYRVSNAGAGSAFLAYATSSAPVATIPVDGTPGTGMYLPSGADIVFDLPHGCYFAAITPSGTATLYITPGEVA